MGSGPDWDLINRKKAEKEVIRDKKLKIGMAYKLAVRELEGKKFEGEDLKKQIIEKTVFHYHTAQAAEDQILQPATSQPVQENKCSECGKPISPNVSEFSIRKFKKPLCMNHQKVDAL